MPKAPKKTGKTPPRQAAPRPAAAPKRRKIARAAEPTAAEPAAAEPLAAEPLAAEPVTAELPAATPAMEPEPEPSGAAEAAAEPPLILEPPPVVEPPPAREPVCEVRRAPMYVVQITPELAPVAKVGGLGDVVFGLTRELELRGNTAEIVLPKYDCMRYEHIWGLHECYRDLWVPWWGGKLHCTVLEGHVHGRHCYFIEPHSRDNYFSRGCFYGHNDDLVRFAFFSRAAMEFLYKSGKHPEIIHCHDWQTALVPVFLYEIYQHLGMRHSRVCYTIHNFGHQGVAGEWMLWATELGRPGYYFHYDRLRDNRNAFAINLMKGGIVYSNFVSTVSPHHAWEAKRDQGFGLEPTLHVHHVKYGGVLNGVDYDVWNPEVDRFVPHRYGAGNIQDKYLNKGALRRRLWLADNEKPIIGFVGRLDPQKGLELVRHAVFYAIRNRAQFVLLGTAPDPAVNHAFWQLKRQLNDCPDCHIELRFDEELSHLVYAGADLMVVPSRYEPCGLTQMVAMRYGTVPVVRAIGGMVDTVFDKDHDWRPLDQRNGYVFQHYDQHALENTLARAIACYYQYPEHFRHLMLNGMRYDYSWKHPGEHYLNIYEYIRDR